VINIQYDPTNQNVKTLVKKLQSVLSPRCPHLRNTGSSSALGGLAAVLPSAEQPGENAGRINAGKARQAGTIPGDAFPRGAPTPQHLRMEFDVDKRAKHFIPGPTLCSSCPCACGHEGNLPDRSLDRCYRLTRRDRSGLVPALVAGTFMRSALSTWPNLIGGFNRSCGEARLPR